MAGFRKLAERLEELADLPSRITRTVAAGINDELRAEFDAGHNAYGNAWKPLKPQTVKRKGGDARILMRTDALANETLARPTAGSGIEIASLAYGTFHQTGTKHMVARKILPDGDALPKSWQRIIENASAEAFAKALK